MSDKHSNNNNLKSSALQLKTAFLEAEDIFKTDKLQKKSTERKRLFQNSDSSHTTGELKKDKVVDDEWIRIQTALEKKSRLYDDIKHGIVRNEDALFSADDRTKIIVDQTSNSLPTFVDEFGRVRSAPFKDDETLNSYKEVRNLGIGFYSFSERPDQKVLQLSELKESHLQTEKGRASADLKNRRNEMHRAKRLEIALQRKRRLLKALL